ncbi:MAG TPA: hypothetical protein VKZ53_12215 [Candidatus Angelobacter sp.]|nr:hypothetical protein [Candidatus Angelobacter sp.]
MISDTSHDEAHPSTSLLDSADFPRFGGVFLGPVPQIEQSFYDEIVEELRLNEPAVAH